MKPPKTLRAARIARHWSQATLAKHLGITQSAVAGYELGTRKPSLTVAAKIEDLLDVRPSSFVRRRRRAPTTKKKTTEARHGRRRDDPDPDDDDSHEDCGASC